MSSTMKAKTVVHKGNGTRRNTPNTGYKNHIIVITDAKEEYDDEVSLYFLKQYCKANANNVYVDVYFVKGHVDADPTTAEERKTHMETMLPRSGNFIYHTISELSGFKTKSENIHVIQIGPVNKNDVESVNRFVTNFTNKYSYYLLGDFGTTNSHKPTGCFDGALALFNNAKTDERYILNSNAPSSLFSTPEFIQKVNEKNEGLAERIRLITFRNTICRGGPSLLVSKIRPNNNPGANYSTFKSIFNALKTKSGSDFDGLYDNLKKSNSTELQKIRQTIQNSESPFLDKCPELFRGKNTITFKGCDDEQKGIGLISIIYASKLMGFTPDYKIYKTHEFKDEHVNKGNLHFNGFEKWKTKLLTVNDNTKHIQLTSIYDLSAIIFCLGKIEQVDLNYTIEKKQTDKNTEYKLYSKQGVKENNDELLNALFPSGIDRGFLNFFTDPTVSTPQSSIPQPQPPSTPQPSSTPTSYDNHVKRIRNGSLVNNIKQHWLPGGSKPTRKPRNPMKYYMNKFVQGGGDPNSKKEVRTFVTDLLKNKPDLNQRVIDYHNMKNTDA